MKTTLKLAQALADAGAPQAMIDQARDGYYDDYASPLALPITQLIKDADAAGLSDIAKRAISGDFDGSKEEADEWVSRWQKGEDQ